MASLSAAATKRRIRSSKNGDKVRNRRWISLCCTSTSIKQNHPHLFYLFSDRPFKQKKTEQTLDTYGNITQTKLYDWGNLSSPARTYNHSYLTNSNYTSRYIFNRPTSSTVTGGGQTVTLVSNGYDSGALTARTYLYEHDTANYGTSFVYRAT